MRKLLYGIAVLLLCSFYSQGQEVLCAKEMVAVTPVIPDGLDLPDYAKKALEHKLIQITTQNGFGSISGEIALTANVITTDKQVTGTIPAQYVVSLEVSLIVVNVLEGTIINEIAVPLKGIDKAENRAITMAFNNLNPRSPAIRNFMKQCRKKIIDYYTTRIPALTAKAKSLADRTEYDQALSVLASIPESVDEYPAIADQMVAIYMKKIDKDGTAFLQNAKAKLAQHDLEGALNELIRIDPSSNSFTKATGMIDAIKQEADEKEKAELEREMQQLEAEKETQQKARENQVMLEKLRIEAAKKAGENYTRTSSSDMEKQVSKWFLERFK